MNTLRFSHRLIASLLLAGSLISPALAQESEGTATTVQAASASNALEEKQQWQPTLADEPLEGDTVVMAVNGVPLDVTLLNAMSNLRMHPSPNYNPRMHVARLRGDDLRTLGQYLGAFDLIAEKARAQGIALDEEIEQRAENTVRDLTFNRLYNEMVIQKAGEITDEQVQAEYEENKESYAVEEELRLRHIYVSTYVPYEVKEGDTLASIAEEVSGDASVADMILSDETKEPRSEESEGENGETLPPRALVVGEKLLVPMNAEQEAEAKSKIDKAYEALQQEGAKFVEVAKEFSESANAGSLMRVLPAQQERDINPVLRETFMKLDNGEYSEPIRTKHGFQIVMRENYTEEGYRALEDVRSGIERNLANLKRRDLANEFLASITEDGELFAINMDAVQADQTEKKPEDVIVRVGLQEITRQQIEQATNGAWEANLEEEPTREDVRNLLQGLPPVQTAMLEAWIRKTGYGEREDVAAVRTAVMNSFYADQFLRNKAQEQVDDPSEDAIEAAYADRLPQFTTPETFTLYQVYLPIDPTAGDGEQAAQEAKAELESRLAGVQSLAEFQEVANTTNDPTDKRRFRMNGELGRRPASQFDEETVDAFRSVEIPGLTDVLVMGEEVTAYWVEATTPEKVTPLEDVRENLVNELRAQDEGIVIQEIIAEYEGQAEVEVMPEAEG